MTILLALVMLLTITACNIKENAENNGSETDTTSTGEINMEDSTFSILVCGLTLKYPLKWQDKVSVTTSENRVCFAYGDTKLFDLTFNTDEGDILGTVEGEEYTVIRMVSYSFETENQELYAMQEDVNVILQNLMNDYTFVVGEALEKEDNSTFGIKTSVVTMKYPTKWQEKVQIEVTDNGVKFSNNGTPLFDLMFVECNGYLLGTYNGTPIYIVDYKVENDEQAIMQEDVNVILQHLMEDKNFVIGQ